VGQILELNSAIRTAKRVATRAQHILQVTLTPSPQLGCVQHQQVLVVAPDVLALQELE